MTRAWRVLIVGRGRLGSSLARALHRRGAHVASWAGRGRWPRVAPPIDVVLVAVADPHVPAIAARLAPLLAARTPVLHASGALSIDALAALAPRPLGVLHPLVSFASRRAPRLEGTTVVIDGAPAAVRAARRVARLLAMRALVRPLHGPRYHAAAALVANGAAALAHEAVRVLDTLGLPQRDAQRAIGALLGTVADNVARIGVPAALTGPVVRGDAGAVARHRAALDPRARRAYDAVLPVIVEVAREAGLAPAQARAIERAHQRK
ncbi:MAG: DUF2520 domain-containing protein [Sandaracinus sp.]